MPTEGDITERRAFWTGLALLPLWVICRALFVLYDNLWVPFRRFCWELGHEFLTDKPWKRAP